MRLVLLPRYRQPKLSFRAQKGKFVYYGLIGSQKLIGPKTTIFCLICANIWPRGPLDMALVRLHNEGLCFIVSLTILVSQIHNFDTFKDTKKVMK